VFSGWLTHYSVAHHVVSFLPGLDGAAFSSRMPAGKLTQQEMECFPDIAHGSQSAVMEFLFIRNKLLQTWLQDPTNELTIERAQSVVVLPQSGEEGVRRQLGPPM